MVIAGYAALASPVQVQQVMIDWLPRCAPLRKPDLPLTFDAAGASFCARNRLTGHGRCFGSFYHESRQFFEDAEIARSKLPGGASSRPTLCDQQKESSVESASGLAVSCRAGCGTLYRIEIQQRPVFRPFFVGQTRLWPACDKPSPD